MNDAHFTPEDLAAEMLSYLPAEFEPKIIADFAAGHGSLLNASFKKWPKAKIIANDICNESYSVLKKNKNWLVSKSNFLLPKSRQSSFYSNFVGDVDLVILNPPFSVRRRDWLIWNDINSSSTVKASYSAIFTLLSISYLKENGKLLAILPSGTLESQRDSLAWDIIKDTCSVEVLKKNHSNTFKNVTVNTVIVLISKLTSNKNSFIKRKLLPKSKSTKLFNIFRGSLPVYKAKIVSNGVPYIHTTNLLENKINIKNFVEKNKSLITGPSLLIPRVGKCNEKKLCILRNNETVAISDCIIAISHSDENLINLLFMKLKDDINTLLKLYIGTGAQYIRVNDLSDYIDTIHL